MFPFNHMFVKNEHKSATWQIGNLSYMSWLSLLVLNLAGGRNATKCL